MGKLNFERYWLTESLEDGGDTYGFINSASIFDHRQALFYYKSGIELIDKLFNNYIKDGYVYEIVFAEKGIGVGFSKYHLKVRDDFALFQIRRNRILDVTTRKSSNLEIVKLEKNKHLVKGLSKRAFGVIGILTGVIAESIPIKENTEFVDGVIFDLRYINKDNVESTLSLYCSEEVYADLGEYFLSYSSNILPDNLKKPI